MRSRNDWSRPSRRMRRPPRSTRTGRTTVTTSSGTSDDESAKRTGETTMRFQTSTRNSRIGLMLAVALLSPATGTLMAQTAAPKTAKTYTPGKPPWGDPNIAGVYTNNDESLIPFERPAAFEGRRLEDITEAELEHLRDDRSEDRIEADRNRAEFRSPIHWFENHFPVNSRAWLVTNPPDGHVPPLIDEGRQRNAARAAARRAGGPPIPPPTTASSIAACRAA